MNISNKLKELCTSETWKLRILSLIESLPKQTRTVCTQITTKTHKQDGYIRLKIGMYVQFHIPSKCYLDFFPLPGYMSPLRIIDGAPGGLINSSLLDSLDSSLTVESDLSGL